ncbi:sulfite exporter TauE/SafE family protein [Marinibacterium sp. SX1]|uniref:sulfite exporter TauE/SafE family protein n=1 Tax=Marinibacterium sp. SX1 TaxID=3388424 RepID=UPI003D182DC4
MPDAIATALGQPGLGWLFLAALVAGSVRGFAGFGTGMIFVPAAAQVLDPFQVLLVVMVMDLFGPIPNLPAAWRTADKGDLARLLAGTLIFLPLGLLALGHVAPEMFQVSAALVALAMVGCMILGLRYQGRLGHGLIFGTGSLAGFLGGVSGIPGPPVILLYMASPNPAGVVRASVMIYLFAYDLLLGGILAAKGVVTLVPVLLGLGLALPNVLGNMLGGWLFRPGLEKAYRVVAYVIITASALSALRIWE